MRLSVSVFKMFQVYGLMKSNMKKFIYLSIIVATTLTTISCNKIDVSDSHASGTPVYIDVEDVIFDEPETKISFVGVVSSKYNFNWEIGDAFKLFSFKWDEDKVLDWGYFTSRTNAKYGRFYGTIPAGFNPADYTTSIAVYCPSTPNFTLSRTSTTGRYNINFNIPSEQDGTGIKYCLLAPQANLGANSYFNIIRNEDGTYAFKGTQFRCFTALNRLVVPTDANIKTIKVTVSHALVDTWCLASAGTAKDMTFNCLPDGNFGGLGGGGSKTITINNGDQTLNEVFFASRQTKSDKNNGYATLTFEFINGDGNVATKKVVLAKNYNTDTGLAETYFNLKNYWTVNDFGEIAFNGGDFKAVTE